MQEITPLSQRVASENWKKRQADKGLKRVEVWIPESKEQDLKALEQIWRIEHELNG